MTTIDYDAEERMQERLLERVADHAVRHADIQGGGFVGTISQVEMGKLIRALGTYVADATEQHIRISLPSNDTMLITIGSGLSTASIDITDSIIQIKEA